MKKINVTNNLDTMMKRNNSWKYCLMTLGLAGLFILQSCDSESYDVNGDTQNFVYMNLQQWSPINCPKNTFMYSVFRTPVSSELTSGTDVKLSVQCTQPASKDITVTFEVDRSAQLEGFTPFPANVAVTMDKKELVIPQGQTKSSEEITVSVEEGKWSLFQEDIYLLPIKITSVSNAELSRTLKSAYIGVETDYSNCVSGATSVPGTKIADRSTWTAAVNGSDAGVTMFDGKTNTYASFNTGTFEVDLQKVCQNVTGMQFDFTTTNYAMTAATVYTSATGKDDYELQGSITITRKTSEFIQFYGPVNARYIKVEMTEYNSRYGLRLTEFNVFQQ